MSYSPNPGKATLFINRSDNEKAPKLKGTICTPDGHEYELAFWAATDRETGKHKLTAKGDKYYTGSVNPKNEQQQPLARSRPAPARHEDDDEAPF